MLLRNDSGDIGIADDDGAVWRLYMRTAADSQVLRLASLSDEYGNALEMGWDEQACLVSIHDATLAIDVTLHHDDKQYAQRPPVGQV